MVLDIPIMRLCRLSRSLFGVPMSDALPYSTDEIEKHIDWAIDAYDPKELALGYARLLKPENPVELLLTLDLAKARFAVVQAVARRDAVYQWLEFDARKAFAQKLATEARDLVKKWQENPAEHHLLRKSSHAIQALIEPWEQFKSLILDHNIPNWSIILPCLRAEGQKGLTQNTKTLAWQIIKLANPKDHDTSAIMTAPLNHVAAEDRTNIKGFLQEQNENRLSWDKCKQELLKIADKHLCILENDRQQALEAEATALEDYVEAYTTKESREWLKNHQTDIRTLTVRFNEILRMFNTLRNSRTRKSRSGKSSGESSGSSGPGNSSGYSSGSSSSSSNSGRSGTSGSPGSSSHSRPQTDESRPGGSDKNQSLEMQPENASAPELQFNIAPDSNATDNAEPNANGNNTTDVDSHEKPSPEPLRPGEAKKLESRIMLGMNLGITDEQVARLFAGWEEWRLQYSDEELQKFLNNLRDRADAERYRQLFEAEKARRQRRSQTPDVA